MQKGPYRQFKNQKALNKALFLVAAFLLVGLSTCTVVPADYSQYANVNLINGYQFDNVAWTPGEANGPNMQFTQVIDAAGLNPSADNGAGYGAGALESSLQSAVSASVILPIYRLETKNLLIDGDLETGTFAFDIVGIGIVNRVTTSSPIFDLKTIYNPNDNHWLDFSNSNTGSDVFGLNLATHIAAFSAAKSYNLSFVYCLNTTNGKQVAVDNAAQTDSGVKKINFENTPHNTVYRFPFTPGGITSALIEPNAARQYLFFNSTNTNNISGNETRAINGSIDDIQLVQSDLPNAVRLNIPWVDVAGLRPDLHVGGHYTVSFWVRRDLTTHYSGNAAAVPNRFDPDFVSVALQQGIPNSLIGAVKVHSIGSDAAAIGTNHANISNWTQITATFSGPAQTQTGLQIAISATNLDSSGYRTPGSLLIANPSLTWSPN